MYRRMTLILMILIPAAGCSGPVAFEMHTIDADSQYEGVGVHDINRDGHLDLQCGPNWYEGPTWERHHVREIGRKGSYYLGFCDLPVDVDGDGWTDTINGAWHNKQLSWVRNPGESGGEWTEIPIDTPGNIETAILADVNDDGQPDVLPDIFNGEPGWYEFHRDPAEEHGVRWTKHPLPVELAGPGIGTGDINGDGRLDIVGQKGWAEQPANLDDGVPWTWHAEFDLGDPSIPILVHDVDADGDLDLIWGMGHGYGVYWMEHVPDPELQPDLDRWWVKHEIDTSFSQAHVVLLGDLNGDGDQELVTGKRWHAHDGKDPGGNEPRCLYWYDYQPATGEWVRHVIQEDGPAGVGTSADLTDIDRDGDPDLVCPGKSGLYLFENLRIR